MKGLIESFLETGKEVTAQSSLCAEEKVLMEVGKVPTDLMSVLKPEGKMQAKVTWNI